MKKNNRQFRKIWNIILTLVMLLSSVTLSPVQAEDLEPEVLTNLVAIVSQNGVTINEGGTIDSTEPIRVEISFGIPVLGDDPEPETPVKKGDTVTFELSNAFRLLSSTPIVLNMGATKVGTATFSTDSITGMVTATVTFDGDDEVFDGRSNNVTARFIADFEYDRDLSDGDSITSTVLILEKSYTLNVPALPIVYDVAKSGVVDLADQSITWTVNVSSIQDTTPETHLDLAGLEFFDNLQTVGVYIPGSFQIGGVDVSPVVVNNTLSYVFPTGTMSPKVITFKTAISNNAYYATSVQNVSNTALLRAPDTTTLDNGQATVNFSPPNWIAKAGEASDPVLWITDPTSRTITWTITANPAGASLDNVIITDSLPNGLTLINAVWETWNGVSWEAPTPITPNPSNGYEIGNINSMIRLVIVSDVTDESFTTASRTYTNSASIVWDGLPVPAISSGPIGVGVGYNAITKSGVSNPANQTIRWTVQVDVENQAIPNMRVYDLLVYGNSINLNTVTGIPSGILTNELTPRFGQKYANNFSGAFTVNVIPILQGATRVADLVEVTGLSTAVENTFSFDSQVIDPNIFAGNSSFAGNPNRNVSNTASLFSGTTRLNAATGTVTYVNRMLVKAMLDRSTHANPAAGVNTLTTDPSRGFNYIDKTAVFRISVNASGIDLTNTTNADGLTLGTVTLTDTLPEGWEFVEIVNGENYLIFEGTGQTNGSVTASDTTPDTVTGLSSSISGRTATFTFDTLNRPYVILVKAKVRDEIAAQYFSTNQVITRTNNVNLNTVNWSTGVSSSQNITVTSGILDKSRTRPTEGELLWTVNYMPYDIDQPVDRLEDQLPVGIDLRLDSSGNLVLAGNIAMYEMSLNADGTYTLGSPVALILGSNISYNNATRTLVFIIPDSSKAYRFTYYTDITGEPGTVSNRVSLIGSNSEIVGVLASYLILSSDGSASLSRNGWIRIKKTNGSGSDLANAGFTLFAMDNTTVIKTGITGSDGFLTMRVIPDGTYILRETAAPAGYALEDTNYSVVVTTNNGLVTTSINGVVTGNNPDATSITVRNFLVGTAGNLTLSKTVVGVGADLTKAFDFTLNLTGASGTYAYVGNGVPGGTISSGGTVSLRHGQSITVLGIPLDATYSVVEEDYTADGYTTSSLNASGTIIVDTTQNVSFTNTFNVGNLVVSKTVAGVSGETNKSFDFIVTFDGAPATYNYIGSGVADGTITSGDTISLSHGQSIQIIGIPAGTTYSVVELDYSIDGYTTASATDSSVIVAGATQTAAFTNTREIGNLVISKNVLGTGADLTKLFTFTLTLEDKTGTYSYIGNGVPNGQITSGGAIKLAHGQSITVVGLPMNTTYQVVEDDYSFDGYSSSSVNASGTIEVGTAQVAAFTNTFDLGNLTIRKTVSGNAASTTKAFEFTLTLTGTNETYRYIGTGIPNGTITSGATISLSHGQSITIVGLPIGTEYRVVESDYTWEGYSLVSTDSTGTVMAGTTHLASFVNTRTFGLPKTGDDSTNSLAWLSLILFSSMFIFLLNERFKIFKK